MIYQNLNNSDDFNGIKESSTLFTATGEKFEIKHIV